MTYPEGQGYGQGQDNWSNGTFAEPSPDDFEFGDVSFNRDAEEIESQRKQYRQPPQGEWDFFVEGFYKAPEPTPRSGYIDGQQVTWTAYTVGVRLAMVDDPEATILDFFDLPPVNPTNPDEVYYYINASSSPDGKSPGFQAEKLGHFLARLGWTISRGTVLPAEAKRLGNWKGRRVRATVGTQKPKKGQPPKIDPTTGLPYPPKLQVLLFSYRPASQHGTVSPTSMAAHSFTPQVQGPQGHQVNVPIQTQQPGQVQLAPQRPVSPGPGSGQPAPSSRLDQLRGRL
jgi:hypothetical protein